MQLTPTSVSCILICLLVFLRMLIAERKRFHYLLLETETSFLDIPADSRPPIPVILGHLC